MPTSKSKFIPLAAALDAAIEKQAYNAQAVKRLKLRAKSASNSLNQLLISGLLGDGEDRARLSDAVNLLNEIHQNLTLKEQMLKRLEREKLQERERSEKIAFEMDMQILFGNPLDQGKVVKMGQAVLLYASDEQQATVAELQSCDYSRFSVYDTPRLRRALEKNDIFSVAEQIVKTKQEQTKGVKFAYQGRNEYACGWNDFLVFWNEALKKHNLDLYQQ
jgi:hypothetical protein